MSVLPLTVVLRHVIVLNAAFIVDSFESKKHNPQQVLHYQSYLHSRCITIDWQTRKACNLAAITLAVMLFTEYEECFRTNEPKESVHVTYILWNSYAGVRLTSTDGLFCWPLLAII